MRMDIGRKAAGNGETLHDASHAARGEAPAASVYQQNRVLLMRAGHYLCAFRQKGFDRNAGRVAERHITLFVALPSDQNALMRPIDLIELDSDKLRVAQSRAVQKLEDDAVAFRKSRSIGRRMVEHSRHF